MNKILFRCDTGLMLYMFILHGKTHENFMRERALSSKERLCTASDTKNWPRMPPISSTERLAMVSTRWFVCALLGEAWGRDCSIWWDAWGFVCATPQGQAEEVKPGIRRLGMKSAGLIFSVLIWFATALFAFFSNEYAFKRFVLDGENL